MINSKALINTMVACLILVATPGFSAETGTTWFGDTADGQFLIGIKAGTVTNNESGFKDANNATLVLGYQFARQVGNGGSSSLELELGDTYDRGEVGQFGQGEWETSTIGLFFNYRTAGTVYFKAKLGVQQSDIKVLNTGSTTGDQTDASFAYGAGFGVLLGEMQNINLEVEWTGASGDNNIDTLNIGGLVRF